jgi:oligopeptide/dipeptide ABC transporter ATP-binding protein
VLGHKGSAAGAMTAQLETSSERSAADPLLTIEGLVKSFPQRGRLLRKREHVHAIDGVSLTVRAGETLGLVGETGCGKSTLARVILRLVSADAGRIVFDGTDVLGASRAELKRLRRQMQIVFQDPHGALDPRMKIGASLAAPLSAHHIGTRADRNQRVIDILETVGLDPAFADRFPSECSGGQLQRVVIARALSLGPRLLICDEPTSSLDASVRAQTLNVLADLSKRLKISVIMISHDLRVVKYMCDRVAVMYLGQIVEVVDRAEAFERPLHPYTRKLIAASLLERSTSSGPDAAIIQGEPPSPLHPPTGCRFNPRCDFAQEKCRQHSPALEEVEPAHWVSCFYWNTDEALVASGRHEEAEAGRGTR